MRIISRTIAHIIEGIMFGVAVAFLLAVGVLATALAIGHAAIPGVLTAWTERAALVLDPSWAGILTVAITAIAVCAVARLVWAHRRPRAVI